MDADWIQKTFSSGSLNLCQTIRGCRSLRFYATVPWSGQSELNVSFLLDAPTECTLPDLRKARLQLFSEQLLLVCQ